MGLIQEILSEITVLTFELPKISLNEWYAGSHWSNRKKIKDQYKWIVRSVTSQKFTYPCEVSYRFEFKTRPLDCSNCIAMVKMLEDCLFPDDGVKMVQKISIESRKSDKELVTVTIIKSKTDIV